MVRIKLDIQARLRVARTVRVDPARLQRARWPIRVGSVDYIAGAMGSPVAVDSNPMNPVDVRCILRMLSIELVLSINIIRNNILLIYHE